MKHRIEHEIENFSLEGNINKHLLRCKTDKKNVRKKTKKTPSHAYKAKKRDKAVKKTKKNYQKNFKKR